MEDLARGLIAQYTSLKNDRSEFDYQFQQVSDYGLGRREFTGGRSSKGRKRQKQIYDATFQLSSDALTAALQGLLINSASRWQRWTPEDPELLEDEENREWIRAVTDVMYHRGWNHLEAGFATQSHELLSDVVNFGTGAMFIGEKPGTGLFFSSRPLSEIFITENSEGRVNAVYRRFFLTADQAVEEYGIESVGDKVAKAYRDPNALTTEFEFVQAVLPRQLVKDSAIGSHRFPIARYDIDVESARVVLESGYHEMPYAIPRWSKDSHELYGRGPGINALSDAITLNKVRKSDIIARQKSAEPTLLVMDDGVTGPTRTSPNAVMRIRPQVGGGRPVEYLNNPARVELNAELIQDLRRQVQGHFHHELLEVFSDPRMTATQVLELASRTTQRIGPMLFRLQNEWLEPTIERVFGILERGGHFPERPERMKGIKLKIDYVSPATKAQQNAEVQSVIGIVGSAMEWSQVFPDVIDGVDPDKALKVLRDAYSGDTDILRSGKAIRKIRDAKNAAAEAQAEQEEMAQLTGMVGQLQGKGGQPQ